MGWKSTAYMGLSVVSGEGVNWGCVDREDLSTGWPELVGCSLPALLLLQSPLASLPLAWQPLEAELKEGGLLGSGPGQGGHWEGEAWLWFLSCLLKPHQKEGHSGY